MLTQTFTLEEFCKRLAIPTAALDGTRRGHFLLIQTEIGLVELQVLSGDMVAWLTKFTSLEQVLVAAGLVRALNSLPNNEMVINCGTFFGSPKNYRVSFPKDQPKQVKLIRIEMI